MRFLFWGISLIILGLFLFAFSIYLGEGGFALFLIFPVFYSTGITGLIAILLIFMGFLLIFLSPFHEITHAATHQSYYEEGKYEIHPAKKEKHYGGVVLIGPIPIIFGSDKNMVMISILATILILVAIGVLFIFLF